MIGMVKNYAKFTAEIQKGINIKGSDVEMKVLIPLKAAQPYLDFLSNSQGKEVNIFVGDPQMSFDFDEDDDAYKLYTGGRRVTTDASGVVTSVQQPEKDENQAELPLDEPVAYDESGQTEDHAGDPVGEKPAGDPYAEDAEELNDYEKEIMGEIEPPADPDLPEWMREQTEQAHHSPEMNFEEGGQGVETDTAESNEAKENSGTEDITPEEVEAYILTQRPSFPDLPLDFPALIERKRTEGVTWRDIARDVGMTSGQLSSKLSKYREEVRKQMGGGGAA